MTDPRSEALAAELFSIPDYLCTCGNPPRGQTGRDPDCPAHNELARIQAMHVFENPDEYIPCECHPPEGQTGWDPDCPAHTKLARLQAKLAQVNYWLALRGLPPLDEGAA